MIFLAAVGAALLTASPCAGLSAVDLALDQAARSVERWPAVKTQLEARFAPLSLQTDKEGAAEQIDFTRGRLHAYCAWVEHPTRAYAAPDAKRLGAILARPEFDQAKDKRADWLKGWLRTVWDWLSGLLDSRGAGRFASGTRALVLGIAAGVVALGAWRVLRLRRGPKRTAPGAMAAAPLRLDPPEDHLRRAQAALESAPREAIREGLLALLSTLERRRLARPDRVKTNGEIVSELSTRGAPAELVAQISPVMRWYDQTFYSLSPVASAEARGFLASVVGLRQVLEGAA